MGGQDRRRGEFGIENSRKNDEGAESALARAHRPARSNHVHSRVEPAIAGQHATYSVNQLVAYRSEQRTTDGDTQMMRTVASGLTDEEIQAVTSYLQGLHP